MPPRALSPDDAGRRHATKSKKKKKRMRKRVPSEIKQRVCPQEHTEKNFNEKNNCRLAGTDITAPFSAVNDRTCSPDGSTPAQHEGHVNEATAPSAPGRTLPVLPLQKGRPGAWCWPWASRGGAIGPLGPRPAAVHRLPSCPRGPYSASWLLLIFFLFLREEIINANTASSAVEQGERCTGARPALVTLGTQGVLGCPGAAHGARGWGTRSALPPLFPGHAAGAEQAVTKHGEAALLTKIKKGKHVHLKASA